MPELKLNKRYKYAGDIMPKLLEIGFDLETAQDFLNSIKDADVVPRGEEAREIFAEIEKLTNAYINGETDAADVVVGLFMLKRKYTGGKS